MMEADTATEFIPGSFWTVERARDAVSTMAARMATPEMQAFMREVAAAAAAGADPAALAAQMAGPEASRSTSRAPIAAEACRYRRGRASDAAAFANLIMGADLPPLFIEEFVQGFVAVEHAGELAGCGGLEVYGDCGVIRSIVVDERGRGQHIGERITELLIADAVSAGVTDLYLFTQHAHNFWLRQRFVDVPLDAWKEQPRASWQYQFISQFPSISEGVYSMWSRA